jgi:hypothetical protein
VLISRWQRISITGDDIQKRLSNARALLKKVLQNQRVMLGVKYYNMDHLSLRHHRQGKIEEARRQSSTGRKWDKKKLA